mgnify:CR=1 FL=1
MRSYHDLTAISGVEFSSSPDALGLDQGAAHLTPAAATCATSLGRKNGIAAGTGMAAAIAMGSAAITKSSSRVASACLLAVAGGTACTFATAAALGGAVCDARVAAVARRGGVSCTLAALAALAAAGLSTRSGLSTPAATALRCLLATGVAHAGFMFASAVSAEALAALGWRASLRVAPLGLWLPRVVLVRGSEISGTKEDVASRARP